MKLHKWKNVYIAVQGVDHMAQNKVCQDSVYSVGDNGVHVIALADGAGSRSASDQGARVLTQEIAKNLATHFDAYYLLTEHQEPHPPHKIFQSLRDKLLRVGRTALNQYLTSQPNLSYRDLASTLLFFAFKDDRYIMGHIGDGIILGLKETIDQEFLTVLSKPDNGDQPNITFFFTENDIVDHFRLYRGSMRGLKGVVLMSDGPEEVLYHPEHGVHDNVYKIFHNFSRQTEENYSKLLEKLLKDNVAKYSYDDLSVNLLYLESITFSDNDSYTKTFLKGIRSDEQFYRTSQTRLLFDETIKSRKTVFHSQESLLEYLRSLT